MDHLARVVEEEPDRDIALYWLARAKKSLGQFKEAAELCDRALLQDERNPIIWNELGLNWMSLNQASEAENAFRKATRLDPLNGAYTFNLGLALFRLDRIYKAKDAFEECLILDPKQPEAYLELARILDILDLKEEAVQLLKKGKTLFPRHPELTTALAAACGVLGWEDRAEKLFREAESLDPVSLQSYGLWLQQQGRFSESIDRFKQSISANPVQGVSYFGLAEAKAFDLAGASLIESAEKYLESDQLDLKERTHLAYGLAKLCEAKHEDERAMGFFDLANESAFRLFNEGRPYDRGLLEAMAEQTRSHYTSDFLSSPAKGASNSQVPIFIVGMIRSGTTLLDQIISSHPEVRSAGEPVFWMRQGDLVARLKDQNLSEEKVIELAKSYLQAIGVKEGNPMRVTDKMPLNYAHVGLIHRVFPRAKIIHLRRRPIDTCLSIYTTYLGRGPNFAYRQSNIVFNYLLYLKTMAHWRISLPRSTFLEVDYEDLVENRQALTKTILEFSDLTWDDSLLHHDRNELSIRTPSKWQARQPIYSSSIDRWKRFEPWLGELSTLKHVVHE